MKYLLYSTLYLLPFLFFSCTTDSSPEDSDQLSSNQTTTDAATDTVAFEPAFESFLTALQNADTSQLQQYIHPEQGLWVIEQPGAVPQMTLTYNFSRFKRHYQDRSLFTVGEEIDNCNLIEEPFPDFDCADMEGNNSGYAKDGCFVWDPDQFKQSNYWEYASLSNIQMQQVRSSVELVQKSVLHTQTSYEFHFGYLNGHWRLLFIKLIYPCSA